MQCQLDALDAERQPESHQRDPPQATPHTHPGTPKERPQHKPERNKHRRIESISIRFSSLPEVIRRSSVLRSMPGCSTHWPSIRTNANASSKYSPVKTASLKRWPHKPKTAFDQSELLSMPTPQHPSPPNATKAHGERRPGDKSERSKRTSKSPLPHTPSSSPAPCRRSSGYPSGKNNVDSSSSSSAPCRGKSPYRCTPR